MVLDATLLNTQHYNVRIRGKVEQSREWSSTPSSTSWCSSYWKGSLRVTLNKGCQLYLFLIINKKSHSIDKVNFAQEDGNRKHYLQLHLFQRNLFWWLLSYPRNMSQHDLLHWQLCPEPFLYWRVSMFPLHGLSFPLRLVVAKPCLAYL